MPIGNMGAAYSVPKPGSPVLTEALNLIVAMGGGDPKIKTLLEEMKAVQTHNEDLVVTAREAVAEANKRAAETLAGQEALAKERAEFSQTAIQASARIAQNDRECKEAAARTKEEAEARARELDERERLLKLSEERSASRENDVQRRESELQRWQNKLGTDQMLFEKQQAELNASYKRLRAALPQV